MPRAFTPRRAAVIDDRLNRSGQPCASLELIRHAACRQNRSGIHISQSSIGDYAIRDAAGAVCWTPGLHWRRAAPPLDTYAGSVTTPSPGKGLKLPARWPNPERAVGDDPQEARSGMGVAIANLPAGQLNAPASRAHFRSCGGSADMGRTMATGSSPTVDDQRRSSIFARRMPATRSRAWQSASSQPLLNSPPAYVHAQM